MLTTCESIRLQREVKVADEINVAHHCILKIGRLSWPDATRRVLKSGRE